MARALKSSFNLQDFEGEGRDSMDEIGCSSICFRRLDVYSALTRILGLGFRAADIGMIKGFCPHFDPTSAGREDRAKLIDWVKRSGLSIPTLNVGRGSLNNPAERDEQKRFVLECMKLAHELGCYAVTVQPGALPKGPWRKEAEQVAGDLRGLADHAATMGLMLTVEAPHSGSLASRIDQALELVDLAGSTNLRIALDTSHVMKTGVQPSEAVELIGDRIGHVHLRDARGEDVLLTPGDGEVDFKAFRQSLRAVGYGRSMVLELEHRGRTEDETAQETLKARSYLQAVWG